MARIIFVALLVLVAACAVMTQTTPKCGENEYWNDCGNECLEPDCGQDMSIIRCATYCEARCQCLDGYCRNKGNKCVLIENR